MGGNARYCPAVIRRLLLVALVAAHSPLPPPAPPSCKPTAPIDLDVRLVGDPAAPFGITAKASSRSGLPVELEIVLPDGVRAVAGQSKARGRACEARLDAVARDRSRREILVRATVRQDGAILTRVAPIVLFDAPAAKSAAKRNSRGEAIQEFGP